MSGQIAEHDDPWFSRAGDAVWLAAQLRQSRLTVLQGHDGSGKTTLLRHGLLALLQRRSSDRSAMAASPSPAAPEIARPARSAASNIVIPFPDRRRAVRMERAARDEEIVIYQCDWEGSPVETLRRALEARMGASPDPRTNTDTDTSVWLVDRLSMWHAQRGTRFLLVLDDFDHCLKGSIGSAQAGEFIDQWVRILGAGSEHTHTLLALSEPAEPLWHLLGTHMAGLGDLGDHRLLLCDTALRMPPARAAATPLAAPPTTPPDSSPDQEPDAEQIRNEAIEEALEDSDEIESEDWTGVPRPPMNSDLGILETATGRRPQPRRADGLMWTIVAGIVLLVLVGGWIARHGESHPTPMAPMAPIAPLAPTTASTSSRTAERAAELQTTTTPPIPATPASPAMPSPGYELVADAGDSSGNEIVSDLARLLTPKGLSAPTTIYPSGWQAELRSLAERPRLAIATYDVLQAARAADAPPLQVVSPLFSVEVYLLVRQDSPLQFIHQVRDATFNIGPSEGSRALTANGIYRRMFGKSIPARQANTATREDALSMLLDVKSIDVLVLVGAQPDPWLTSLDEDRKRRLRILQLDPADATGSQLTAVFLPTLVRPARGSGLEAPQGSRTLALMTFLVAGAAPQGADAQVRAAVDAICRNLPALKQSGHPKWREVQPGVQLDTGWPNSAAAAESFSQCSTIKP